MGFEASTYFRCKLAYDIDGTMTRVAQLNLPDCTVRKVNLEDQSVLLGTVQADCLEALPKIFNFTCPCPPFSLLTHDKPVNVPLDLLNHSLMAVRILEMLLQLPQDDEPEFGKKEPAPILYTRDKWPSDIVYENVHSPLVTATTQTDGGMTPYVRLVRALHRRGYHVQKTVDKASDFLNMAGRPRTIMSDASVRAARERDKVLWAGRRRAAGAATHWIAGSTCSWGWHLRRARSRTPRGELRRSSGRLPWSRVCAAPAKGKKRAAKPAKAPPQKKKKPAPKPAAKPAKKPASSAKPAARKPAARKRGGRK